MFSSSFRALGHRLSDDVRNLRDLVNTHEGVHLGQQLRQFLAEPLRQAAGNNQALAAILSGTHLGGFEDGIHALLLCGINKRAGVDDDGVSRRGVVGDFYTVFEQRAEHDFGIHQIFGAAERNQAHPQRALVLICLGHRLDNLRDVSLGMQPCR